MADSKPIRIMLVDDHDIVRRGLSVFLKSVDDLLLVGEASNGSEAIAVCGDVQPDVILMDMMMPQMNGVEATRAIRDAYPHTQVIMLTTFQDENLVRNALQAGAVGYLLKNASLDDMVNAIRSATAGKLTLSPEAAQSLINASVAPVPRRYNLSARELEVLSHMAKGLNNNEIADRLIVGRSTVKFHVSSILAKLGVASRTEAVALAVQEHIV